ncbi:MAG: ATP-binding protein [Clostridiales bacterium]|nr:ATP-binding protein [Clostridiales bacterium]
MGEAVRNPFVVGKPVTGEAFIGREDILQVLSDGIFRDETNYVLVAPTRAGKSSVLYELLRRNRTVRPKVLMITLSMGDCNNSFAFWYILWQELRAEILRGNLWDSIFETQYNRLERLKPDPLGMWYTTMQLPLKNILERIGNKGFKVVLAIDEFDAAVSLFGQEGCHFQLLRSICYTPKYVGTCILASRRRLPMYEAACPGISTFHGIYIEKALYAFSKEDIELYYQILGNFGITFTEAGKKRLEYYTGRQPYLSSIFGHQMIENGPPDIACDRQEVDGIFKQCITTINTYYEDLRTRLKDDQHLEFIWYLAMGMRVPVATKQHYDNMENMGVLTRLDDGADAEWISYSRHFMDWLAMQPMNLPTWETITACEKKLKHIFALEFPILEETTYRSLNEEVKREVARQLSREIQLNWKTIDQYCGTRAVYQPNASLLDGMTLTWVVKTMDKLWNSHFVKYFSRAGGDNWKNKLTTISNLRCPIAHAGIEYISERDLAVCMKYCDEVIHLKL